MTPMAAVGTTSYPLSGVVNFNTGEYYLDPKLEHSLQSLGCDEHKTNPPAHSAEG